MHVHHCHVPSMYMLAYYSQFLVYCRPRQLQLFAVWVRRGLHWCSLSVLSIQRHLYQPRWQHRESACRSYFSWTLYSTPPPHTHTCKTNRACVRTYVCCAHVNETHFHCIQNEVCSGNGMCDCNVCACNAGFSGRYCERCRSEEVSMWWSAYSPSEILIIGYTTCSICTFVCTYVSTC